MKKRLTWEMDTETVPIKANEENFGFAFNDSAFSDRVLRLEIVPDETIDSSKKKKRKGSGSYDDAKAVTLHISSAILAAKSPFFYKLFKNGMKESQNKDDVSLRINESEQETLMDLINFMYGNALSATSVPDLINLLMAADKFEVTSCMSYCIEMLLKLPMSLEYALSFLELPSNVLISEIVQPLIYEAKKYIAAHFKDFTKSKEEAMELPLSAVEVVLESKGLQVSSEDDVYDFILEWARVHYPKRKERREILTQHLLKLVCFPNMSSSKLKEALACRHFDREQVSKLVTEALFSKAELPCGQHIHLSKDLAATDCGFSGRAYSPSCVVYFDLRRYELETLSQSKSIHSPTFCLGGKLLYLSVDRRHEQGRLRLYLCKIKGTETCTLNFKFGVMSKSRKEFQSKKRSNNRNFDYHGWGCQDLLGIPWTEFMSDDSDYFIDGILRIRAEITLVDNSQS